MKRTLDAMVVPVGREPEPRTLEADESGSFLKALQGCVGGPIEPLSWLFDDAPAGYCSEGGVPMSPSSLLMNKVWAVLDG